MEADREKLIEELILDLEAASKALEKEKALNTNLLRIMTERSNAARGLRPKRKDGFIVLNSQQWIERYCMEIPDIGYEGRDREWLIENDRMTYEYKNFSVWKSIMQTPYDASLPLSTIEDHIIKELTSGTVLKELGCEYYSAENNSEIFSDGRNVAYKLKFKANYLSGVWEVEVYTTGSITVPENRRPQKAVRKHRKEGITHET